jgi:hypothetical protein
MAKRSRRKKKSTSDSDQTKLGDSHRRTVFRSKRYGGFHIRISKDIAEKVRDRDREVMRAYTTLAVLRCVENGTLEVSVGFIVQFAFVLDLGGHGFVGVDRSKLEVGDVALEKVAEMIRDTKTF